MPRWASETGRFDQFLVRVICDCSAVREIQPEGLALLVACKMTLKELAQRMRCSLEHRPPCGCCSTCSAWGRMLAGYFQ